MHHGHCHEHCGCGPHQVQPVVCPTQYRFHDEFTKREVPFIHPIVNVNRHNIIEVPRHYFPETTEDVMGQRCFQAADMDRNSMANTDRSSEADLVLNMEVQDVHRGCKPELW